MIFLGLSLGLFLFWTYTTAINDDREPILFAIIYLGIKVFVISHSSKLRIVVAGDLFVCLGGCAGMSIAEDTQQTLLYYSMLLVSIPLSYVLGCKMGLNRITKMRKRYDVAEKEKEDLELLAKNDKECRQLVELLEACGENVSKVRGNRKWQRIDNLYMEIKGKIQEMAKIERKLDKYMKE